MPQPVSSRFRQWIVAAWLLSLTGLAGCNDGQGAVHGTVTFDGQPLASGAITFVKQGAQPAREGAVIQDGRFHANLSPGSYRIELNSQKVVGTRKQKGMDGNEEEVQLTEELFPPRYNTQTELIEEIKPGPNSIQLDLKGS